MTAKTKLLAVDDNRTILHVLKDGLEREGFDVRTASSGVEALERVLVEKPDVILLDIVMPGVTGYEVCRVLRNDPHTANIPIIMVTATVQDKVRQEGKDAGARDIWAKPLNVSDIARQIRSFLESGAAYEPMTHRRELDLLRENLMRLVFDLRSPVHALSTVAEMLGESSKVEPRQVSEVLGQQIKRVEAVLERLERLAT